MITEKMLELLILKEILTEYDKNHTYKRYLEKHFNLAKMEERYIELGKEFLNNYALSKTEKSD